MWPLAAVALVADVTAFDIYRERRDGGLVFIASKNNVLITREGRYFQVMGLKDQQTSHFTIES